MPISPLDTQDIFNDLTGSGFSKSQAEGILEVLRKCQEKVVTQVEPKRVRDEVAESKVISSTIRLEIRKARTDLFCWMAMFILGYSALTLWVVGILTNTTDN